MGLIFDGRDFDGDLELRSCLVQDNKRLLLCLQGQIGGLVLIFYGDIMQRLGGMDCCVLLRGELFLMFLIFDIEMQMFGRCFGIYILVLLGLSIVYQEWFLRQVGIKVCYFDGCVVRLEYIEFNCVRILLSMECDLDRRGIKGVGCS